MVRVYEEYPFEGNAGLVRHFCQDENGVPYLMEQVETGEKYQEAIDIYPCKYTYIATDIKDVEEPELPQEPDMGV